MSAGPVAGRQSVVQSERACCSPCRDGNTTASSMDVGKSTAQMLAEGEAARGRGSWLTAASLACIRRGFLRSRVLNLFRQEELPGLGSE